MGQMGVPLVLGARSCVQTVLEQAPLPAAHPWDTREVAKASPKLRQDAIERVEKRRLPTPAINRRSPSEKRAILQRSRCRVIRLFMIRTPL